VAPSCTPSARREGPAFFIPTPSLRREGPAFSYLRHARVAKDLLFSYLRHPRVAKDLLFSYLCRSSLYAGADIGQEEIPVRLTRCPDRGHCVASRQGRPRGEALHRVERRARDRRRLRNQDRRMAAPGPG